MRDLLAQAEEVLQSLPLEALRATGNSLDRVEQNPEAARYFLAYGDWKPVEPNEIFSTLDPVSAAHTHVYVDFPFCPVVCNFCAFYPVRAHAPDELTQYVNSLKQEIRMLGEIYFQGEGARRVESLELGGGTPTYLPLHLLQEVLGTLLKCFPFANDAERSFETTPELILGSEGLAKLRYLRSIGFARISIGAQSFDERVVRAAGRSHSTDQTLDALVNAREAGFERINFDLLLGILDQTLPSFLESVERTIDLDLDVIELYSMRFFDTKRTVPLTKRYLDQPERFVSERELLLGRIAADIRLRAVGYQAFNGRTYFRPKSDSDYYASFYRGNFRAENVLGVGRKSHSNLYPWQHANYRDIAKYCTALDQGRLPIAAGCQFDQDAMLAKHITGALQLADPFDYLGIRDRFAESESRPFDRLIEQFVELGLLEPEGRVYRKTLAGFLFLEEMLKAVFDRGVTPFDVGAEFLGKNQLRPTAVRQA